MNGAHRQYEAPGAYGSPRNYDPATGPIEMIRRAERVDSARAIGEAPNRGGASMYMTRSGARLCDIVGNVILPWRNLFDEPTKQWDWKAARLSAAAIMFSYKDGDSTPLLLLGARVCDAFGLPRDREWLGWYRSQLYRGPMIAVPHPSGLNRWWNDPANVERARAELGAIVRRELPYLSREPLKEDK